MSQRIVSGFLVFMLFFSVKLSAQIIPVPDSDGDEYEDIRVGSRYTLLPVLGYSSDTGFFGGVLGQRINYGNNIRPFLNNLTANFTVSTRGNLITDIKFEHTKTFNTDIRSLILFVGQRIREGHYFGIGNQSDFSNDLFDEDYFFFENREISFYYQARKNVLTFGQYGKLDIAGSVDFSYLNGITRGDESKYEDDLPFGFGKSWGNKAGIGFIADSRDDEFIPTRGFRYEASYEHSSPIFGSHFTYSNIKLDSRHYVQIFENVVIAQKLNLETIQGEAPFWDLSIIGGNKGLRGYHLDRFRGNHSVLHLLELRSWLFSVWNGDLKIGSQIFWDTGRVFSDNDSNRFFENWHQSYGGGFVISIFTPDLMLRTDIGFSDEAFRIYFGTGYVF